MKLKVLVGLLAVLAIWNLTDGRWLLALLEAVLAAGVLRGSDDARVSLMLLCVLSLLGVFAFALAERAHFSLKAQLPPLLALWVLTRADVKRWFHLRA